MNGTLAGAHPQKDRVSMCTSFRVLLPIDPSKNSPWNCHFGFQLSHEFPDPCVDNKCEFQHSGKMKEKPEKYEKLTRKKVNTTKHRKIRIKKEFFKWRSGGIRTNGENGKMEKEWKTGQKKRNKNGKFEKLNL